jgi:hypothetical protein
MSILWVVNDALVQNIMRVKKVVKELKFWKVKVERVVIEKIEVKMFTFNKGVKYENIIYTNSYDGFSWLWSK